MLDDTAIDRLTTPFEDWCAAVGVHPEAPGAWEYFAQLSAHPDRTAAAS